ncbi:MAG TPA: TetR/AcrR family transcriptional regulator [Paracoccaceae bacterium]|nr:TetR/AcrR family transcriptional regulator [Paracoccaceae bacterium]
MPRTIRMAPDERKKELVEKAAEFFSEEGFDAGTRQLARQLGVTQPLIYRYFASKDDLINEVYRKVYVGQWQDSWKDTICDRSRPLRARLQDFYCSYAPAIFNRRWMRIFFFAGLKGLDINTRYLARVRDELLLPIAREMRAELGLDCDLPITTAESELVWLMHGTVFYQGIREQIYRSVTAVDYDLALNTAIDMYLQKAPDVVPDAVARARAGIPDAPATGTCTAHLTA